MLQATRRKSTILKGSPIIIYQGYIFMLPNMQRLQIMNPDFVSYNSVTKALTNLKIL